VVVVEPLAFQQASGVSEILEELLVQQLVPQPTDEALHPAILLRLAGRHVVPRNADLGRPRQDGARG
jgi:hypothetical protein